MKNLKKIIDSSKKIPPMNDFLLFYFEPEEYLNTNKINSKRLLKT